MKVPFKGIKVILFDLGNVIIDLHYDRTLRLIESKTGFSPEEAKDLLVTDPLLQDFEVGAISEETFRQLFCQRLNLTLSTVEFDALWNSFLGNITPERVSALRSIRTHYRTAILSNTNCIHERAFSDQLHKVYGVKSLGSLVDHVFLSHEIGLRKPDPDCYHLVIRQLNVAPHQIMFIDDRSDNLEAAAQAGIGIFLNRRVDDWLGLFS